MTHKVRRPSLAAVPDRHLLARAGEEAKAVADVEDCLDAQLGFHVFTRRRVLVLRIEG